VNTDESELALFRAERRVREIQAKLHRWARDDPHRRFDDLFNLVADPAFLLVAWDRVRGNKGARTAGADGQTVYYVETVRGVEGFLDELRSQLKDRPGRTHRKTRRCAAMFRVLGDSTDPAGSRATRRLLLLPNQKRLPVL
jgi:RNA-directed DNA polymerase